jgi:hypothetical protein
MQHHLLIVSLKDLRPLASQHQALTPVLTSVFSPLIQVGAVCVDALVPIIAGAISEEPS